MSGRLACGCAPASADARQCCPPPGPTLQRRRCRLCLCLLHRRWWPLRTPPALHPSLLLRRVRRVVLRSRWLKVAGAALGACRACCLQSPRLAPDRPPPPPSSVCPPCPATPQATTRGWWWAREWTCLRGRSQRPASRQSTWSDQPQPRRPADGAALALNSACRPPSLAGGLACSRLQQTMPPLAAHSSGGDQM